MGVEKKVGILAVVLLGLSTAYAQFLGYVGLQTNSTRVVNAATAPGRFPVNANIGSSYHTFTYCIASTVSAVQLFIDETPDGDPNHAAQISPVYGFPTGFTSSGTTLCGFIRVGGYYSVLAVHIITLVGGPISVWYSSTAGPVDVQAPFVNSGGATSGVQCDHSITFTDLPPSTSQVLFAVPQFQAAYICGGTISFHGATAAGAIFLVGIIAPTGPSDCGNLTPSILRSRSREIIHTIEERTIKPLPGSGLIESHGIPFTPLLYNVAIATNSPQLFAINQAPNSFFFVPPTAGANVCLVIGTVGATTTLTLNYAQF